MRPVPAAAVLLLLLFTAACDDAPPVATIVHASDPHLLDYKRPAQQELNDTAWRALFSSTRDLKTDAGPHYLVLSGDFGLEAADTQVVRLGLRPSPRAVEPDTSAQAAASASNPGPRADSILQALAARVAHQIQVSAFDTVFFVPGNNDIVLEDASTTRWAVIAGFADRVQAALQPSGKRFIDLTACYRAPEFVAADCAFRIADPYVLVGFPSMALKNHVDAADYTTLALPPTATFDSAAYAAWARARSRQQDSLNQALMRNFAAAVAAAAEGGDKRVIVVTHIPDLDDPHRVGQARARVGPSDRLPRLSGHALDAWNATDNVFRTWRGAVNSPSVAGVLAGHFHDSHRETYYRPYAWSNAIDRADRWRTFVTPPLAVKMQDASPIQARGFSVLRLGENEIRRRLYWYDGGQFAPDAADEPGETLRTPDSAEPRFSPMASGAHFGLFLLAVGACIIALVLWPSMDKDAEDESNASASLPRETISSSEPILERSRTPAVAEHSVPVKPVVSSASKVPLVIGSAPGASVVHLRDRTVTWVRRRQDAFTAVAQAVLTLTAGLGIITLAFEAGKWVWIFTGFWFMSLLVLAGILLGMVATQYRRVHGGRAKGASDW